MEILIGTVIVLGGLGIFFGVLLSFAGKKLKIVEDPKLVALKDALPGVNCGGCGKAGCTAFAEDLLTGKSELNGCPVGGDDLIKKLASILGQDAKASIKRVAYVKCIGSNDKTKILYEYEGINNCRAAARLVSDGAKACNYGCLGGKTCMDSCMFDAIKIIDGIAVVNKEKCTGCKKCVSVCPKNLIEMLPYDKEVRIGCNSKDNGKIVRANCAIGCIGCKICIKKCEENAIEMNGFLPRIDYNKCCDCGTCEAACPRKCIITG